SRDWSSDVCSSDLTEGIVAGRPPARVQSGKQGQVDRDGARPGGIPHFVQCRLELAPRLAAVVVEPHHLARGLIRTEIREEKVVPALESRERRARANRAFAGEAGQQRARWEQPATVHTLEVRTTRQCVVDVELDDDE